MRTLADDRGLPNGKPGRFVVSVCSTKIKQKIIYRKLYRISMEIMIDLEQHKAADEMYFACLVRRSLSALM